MEKKTFFFKIFLPSLILVFLSSGCLQYGNLAFNPDVPEETFRISGTISINEPVESDLMASFRRISGEIGPVKDYSKFTVTGSSGIASFASASGTFVLERIPATSTLILSATAGKIALKKRIFPRDLKYTDLSNLTIDINSTAIALIWEAAWKDGKDLSEADITARENDSIIASLTQAIRLAMLLPKKDVPKTILDLEMVTKLVTTAASTILPREKDLREAYKVLQLACLRKDEKIFEYYISPDFGNDWDSTSNYADFQATIKQYFKDFKITIASFTIEQMEFIPGNLARIRSYGEISYLGAFSDIPGTTRIFGSDVLWKREGTFWKIVRNLPYKNEHPTQVGADGKWGEIARGHAELYSALFREDLNVFIRLISPSFRNDWDVHSTYTDLLSTAKKRFDDTDVKSATYTIKLIEFINNDLAKVHCSSQVRLINVKNGHDVDTGPINAVVDWRREDGVWKLARNLPYKFSHPRNLTR